MARLGRLGSARAIERALTAERERWALWAPVAFGAGIAVYFALPLEPPPWSGAAIAGIAGAGLLAIRGGRSAILVLLLSAVLCAGLGFLRVGLETQRVAAPTLHRDAGVTRIAGTVTAVEAFADGPRVVLNRIDYRWRAPDPAPETVRIRLSAGDSVRIGERIELLAILRAPPRPAYPGAYDFARRAWFEGLGAVGFALGGSEPVVGAGGMDDLGGGLRARAFVDARRQEITRAIRDGLAGEAGAVAAALITGDRSGLSEEAVEAMRRSGLAHLLAISGLHIGLAAGIVFVGLRALLAMHEGTALRRPIKKWAAAAALVAAFVYLLLAGATVPTQRAFLMTGLVLIAVMLDRKAISLRLVAIAAAVVLLLAPQSVLGASFQLSFAAVTALVAVYEGGRPLAREEGEGDADRTARWMRRIVRYLLLIVATTLIAGAATAPFALHHFGRMANYGVIGNLLAIPLMAWMVMPAGVLAMLAMPFGLEAWPLAAMGQGIEWILAIARFVAALPGASIQVAASPAWAAALIAGGGLWAALWRGRWRFWGALPLACGMLLPLLADQPHLIVSGTGRQIAVTGPDGGFWLQHPRRESFATGVWSERTGRAVAGGWETLLTGAGPGPPLACGPLGCHYRWGDRVVAISYDPRTLAEDCRHADVVVSTVAPPRALREGLCRDRRLIDPAALARQGTHALILRDDRPPAVRTVEAARGARPWSR
ncbi:ComEC/Rec2 family competence protein [Marivibrio halodurans]|uniref:ComEC/Rec2 family competence protein n=1 Tax=Marivibrio halodurans TaxID=2039722 RepID=A0A8J7S4G2_9PROT|nr:ComEC/Rec2 family competence protein [Marivibrio halodurans]MBP5855472.1 ComEC/Rec2 family competence protein [Marivibrio halodurans]